MKLTITDILLFAIILGLWGDRILSFLVYSVTTLGTFIGSAASQNNIELVAGIILLAIAITVFSRPKKQV